MNDAVHIPQSSEDHPLLDDLVAYADGELDDQTAQRIAEHLERCTACQHTVATIAPPLAVELPELDELLGDRPGTLAPMEVDDDPLAREVWQLDWEDAAVAAVVIETDATGALVRIVTQDRPVGATEADRLSLAEPDVALWMLPIWTHVPLGVFRYPLAISEPDALDAIPTTFTPNTYPLHGDPAPTDGIDALQRAELASAVVTLAIASWLPPMIDEPLALRDLLRDQHRQPSAVADATGISPAELTSLLRGTRQATPEEADALAAVLEVPAERLRVHVSFPDALVRAVERPLLRSAIESKAMTDGMTEAASRLHTAEAVHAMAARTTRGERDVNTWTELIRQHLDA